MCIHSFPECLNFIYSYIMIKIQVTTTNKRSISLAQIEVVLCSETGIRRQNPSVLPVDYTPSSHGDAGILPQPRVLITEQASLTALWNDTAFPKSCFTNAHIHD